MPYLTPNSLPSNAFVCRVVRIPDDPLLVMAFSGAIIEMTKAYNWEQFGELTPQETAEACQTILFEYLDSDACMIGLIMPFAGTTPPPACLLCDGGTYLREDWPRLYAHFEAQMPGAIIDPDQFSTPDLRNRFIAGAGNDYALGLNAGTNTVALTEAQMPIHSHTDAGHSHIIHSHIPTLALEPGEVPVSSPGFGEATAVANANIQPAGGGEAHENRPPFTALTYVIWGK